MGADLVIASISIKQNPKSECLIHGIRNRVIIQTGLMLEELGKSGINDKEQWADFYDFLNTFNGKIPKRAKDIIKDATKVIEEFSKCLGYRDTTILEYPERTIILSGGMSYGDGPTDSYETITRFSMLPNWLLLVGGFE